MNRQNQNLSYEEIVTSEQTNRPNGFTTMTVPDNIEVIDLDAQRNAIKPTTWHH